MDHTVDYPNCVGDPPCCAACGPTTDCDCTAEENTALPLIALVAALFVVVVLGWTVTKAG